MALRQTYLSLKGKLPPEAEVVLVMRGRGSDELAPSKALFDEFKRREAACRDTTGDPAEAAWRAFREADYEGRFTAEILGSDAARARLGELARRSRERDVFLVCYEGYDKPCHRHLLLQIARDGFGAVVDETPFRA